MSMRCPGCRQQGTFESLSGVNDMFTGAGPSGPWQHIVGIRRCPNPTCSTQVFVVLTPQGVLETSYPPEHFNFDTANIPAKVLKAFEEATSCHATGSYTAAAMMVRKTLELLCVNRDAAGDNLQAKIRDLGKKIIIPADLLQAIDDLRLLGNDAAHVEAKTYDEIGRDEVDAAFELTREILKATYQYAALLGRLKALKKTVPENALADATVPGGSTPA